LPRLIRAALEESGIRDPGRTTSGVDLIGDIAIVRLDELRPQEKRKVAKELLASLKNVKVVMEQEGGIEGEFRLRSLRRLAGERRTLTIHRENGCSFKVDVARCYFSPRLSTERLRVANLVGEDEEVLNMFAGVGPYSIAIARLRGARVMSCELNEYAADLHVENDRINKVEGRVEVVKADARRLPEITKKRFDRILMPHPSEANEFLPTALEMARQGAIVHYYRHVLGRDEEEASQALREELASMAIPKRRYSVRMVREVGPRWVELCAEIRAPG